VCERIAPRFVHAVIICSYTVPLQAHRPTQAFLSGNAQPECKMGVPTCWLGLTRRSVRNDSLLAKPADTDSVQTRQEACAVPRNYPVETLGVGHSEETPVETVLPVDTPVSAKRVVEAGSPTLSERVSASRVG
jgi:hypothetical protein